LKPSTNIRSVDRVSATKAARRWDMLAAERLRQISTGIDTSHSHVLLPSILGSLPPSRHILDLGCGIGTLSAAVAERAVNVVAIDPSEKNIAIANSNFSRPNIKYLIGKLEEIAGAYTDHFDAIVSNMTLMDIIDLDETLQAVRRVAYDGARFLATMTHPCFWPRYMRYEGEPWFDYRNEIYVEAPFKVAAETSSVRTIHVHRPLEAYFVTMSRNDFADIHLTELYGEGAFPFPRFILIQATVG